METYQWWLSIGLYNSLVPLRYYYYQYWSVLLTHMTVTNLSHYMVWLYIYDYEHNYHLMTNHMGSNSTTSHTIEISQSILRIRIPDDLILFIDSYLIENILDHHKFSPTHTVAMRRDTVTDDCREPIGFYLRLKYSKQSQWQASVELF